MRRGRHRECLPNRHSCRPPSEAQPLVVARAGCCLKIEESIAKLIIENVRKLRAIRLSAAAQAVQSTLVTYWHRTYLDGSSDGFGELLLDMFEWNLGPSFVIETA